MAIKNIQGLKRALGNRTKAKVEAVLTDCMSFALTQLCEHRNTTPLGVINSYIPELAGKPSGFKRDTFLHYMTEVIGLEYNKKEQTFSVPKELVLVREGMRSAFWLDYQVEKVETSPAERLEKAIATAMKNGLTFDQMVDILAKATGNEVNIVEAEEEVAEAA